jgi:hypothetical protein
MTRYQNLMLIIFTERGAGAAERRLAPQELILDLFPWLVENSGMIKKVPSWFRSFFLSSFFFFFLVILKAVSDYIISGVGVTALSRSNRAP